MRSLRPSARLNLMPTEPIDHRAGDAVVVESEAPTGGFAVVFEDGGQTGYFYGLDLSRVVTAAGHRPDRVGSIFISRRPAWVDPFGVTTIPRHWPGRRAVRHHCDRLGESEPCEARAG